MNTNSSAAREAKEIVMLRFRDLRINLAGLQAVYRNTRGHCYG
jgi:hypothetical protein